MKLWPSIVLAVVLVGGVAPAQACPMSARVAEAIKAQFEFFAWDQVPQRGRTFESVLEGSSCGNSGTWDIMPMKRRTMDEWREHLLLTATPNF